MLIQRQFVKDCIKSSLAVAATLGAVFFVIRLVGLLGDASDGDIPINSVLVLLGLRFVTTGSILLPLIAYIAVLLVFSRWQRDRELVVLQACGMGLGRFLSPLLVQSLFIMIPVAMLSLELSPMAYRKIDDIKWEYRQRADISGIITGAFTELRRGKSIYYVEDFDPAINAYRNVFIYDEGGKEPIVVRAQTAYRNMEPQTGDNFLVLNKGTRYQGQPGSPSYKVMDFERYSVRMPRNRGVNREPPVNGMTTLSLAAQKNNLTARTEVHWRLAQVATVPILMLFALAFSYQPLRRSSSMNYVFGLIMYFIYANTLAVVRTSVKKGDIDPFVGFWSVHIIFFILALYFVYRRVNQQSLLPGFGRRRQKIKAQQGSPA